MPLLWRYLLTNYLKVFILCVCSFVALLLTLRLDEIAYFATLGPEAVTVAWFALQQVPYVLPIAIPVSALISSVLLMQNLSQSKELTAFRSCGFSIKDILIPILAAALFLSTLNFYIVSELATTSHHTAGQLKNQLRSVNPLLILNNRLLMRMKGFHFDTYGNSKLGEYAQDVIFLMPNHHSGRLSLLVAKRLEISNERLKGDYVSLLTSKQATDQSKETLVLENLVASNTSINEFSHLLEKKIWNVNNDHLPLKQLLIRKDESKELMEKQMRNKAETLDIKEARYDYYRTVSEIARRFSASLAVLSLTLLGLSFGINISRNQSKKGLISIVFFASLYLVCFFTAKSFDQAKNFAFILYLSPHALIWVASLYNLKKIARGIE